MNDVTKTTKRILVPEIKRRMSSISEKPSDTPQGEQFFLDTMIYFAIKKGLLTERSTESEMNNLANTLADHVLVLALEITLPVNLTASNLLYQLLERPEYIRPLREELEGALDHTNGVWSFDMFHRTPKIESFSREALRIVTNVAFTSSRIVKKPLFLPSLGRTIKPGIEIWLPSRWVHLDPEIYPDPERFDGYRFYDPVKKTCEVQDTLTPSPQWLIFAIGSGLCPGRLLGIRTAQAVLGKFLFNFDMQLENDEKAPPFIQISDGLFLNSVINMRLQPRPACPLASSKSLYEREAD
ncbi:hypothetical protein N7462_011629 [Penicillium macrosclerotiorum]|uniref:uncharacterized protein n=1 Tax=Penicillium macrosclerotiorum TaxID=303699 RepID=UPI0025468F6F|nr:uncharacterized protein N7462_011629 [Penicillium macrosclerotiorum]KAJ5662703.1 hypothetical protein N7462_011629 [Penicillium macrosclerotiorum]